MTRCVKKGAGERGKWYNVRHAQRKAISAAVFFSMRSWNLRLQPVLSATGVEAFYFRGSRVNGGEYADFD